ncbi:phage holin family protein [Dawidia soli]|uniref:Phage holin family protein n=1 Tax=Dawidia soli TaxID=2782352 RepID=A0AAP2GLX9_9BACT|nr:phage holin family protein [Dawidia soli]MBT1690668.1 phage holin family protein [Dawidia soli]
MLKESILKMLKLENLVSNLTGFVETRIELMKLEVKEDLAKAIARIALFIIIGFIVTLFILLISMAIAYKIGESTGVFGGFAIVAGFYLILAVVLVICRDAIRDTLEKRLSENLKQKKK